MTDDRIARPFSGRIVAGSDGGARAGAARYPDSEIIDADFIALGRASAPAGQYLPSARPDPTRIPRSTRQGISILRGNRPTASGHGKGGPAFWMIGILVVAGAFWISGGHAVFASFGLDRPEARSRWLRIANVVTRIEHGNGRSFLLVDGQVANDGAVRASLGGLTVIVAGANGRTIRYIINTAATMIEPGGRFGFSSRLEAPQGRVETVTVDFSREGES